MNGNAQNLSNLVFVYGTLKRGGHNYHLLKDKSDYLGDTETMSKHRMVSLGGFPGVLYRAEGGVNIKGEVYQVNNEEVRKSIDRLEGYPHFYDKAQVVTEWGVAAMYVLSKKFRENHDLSGNDVKTGEWICK